MILGSASSLFPLRLLAATSASGNSQRLSITSGHGGEPAGNGGERVLPVRAPSWARAEFPAGHDPPGIAGGDAVAGVRAG